MTNDDTQKAIRDAAWALRDGSFDDGRCDDHETGTREHREQCLEPALESAIDAALALARAEGKVEASDNRCVELRRNREGLFVDCGSCPDCTQLAQAVAERDTCAERVKEIMGVDGSADGP